MSPPVRFRAFVTESRELVIEPEQRTVWGYRLEQLAGKAVYVSVTEQSRARSLSANRYLWGACYGSLASWSGHDPEYLHEALKARFCPATERVLPSGEVLEVRSTALLTQDQFSEYVERVKAFAAECGVVIPDRGALEPE